MGRARAPARDGAALEHQAPTPDADAWRLEPHICRACFSRLVSQDHGGIDRRYHCTNCGLDAVAEAADALCCCGTKIRRPTKGAKSGTTLVDAGIRCIVNPAPTPDFPSVIVAAEVPNPD